MSTLSTHVLDTSLGKPAAGIRVTLERGESVIGHAVTDADGRPLTDGLHNRNDDTPRLI